MNDNSKRTEWQKDVSEYVQVSVCGASGGSIAFNQEFNLTLIHCRSKSCTWEYEFPVINGLNRAVFIVTQNKNGHFEAWFSFEGTSRSPEWSALGIQGLFNTIKLQLNFNLFGTDSSDEEWPREILVTFSPTQANRAYYIPPELNSEQSAMLAGIENLGSGSGSGSESSTSTSSEPGNSSASSNSDSSNSSGSSDSSSSSSEGPGDSSQSSGSESSMSDSSTSHPSYPSTPSGNSSNSSESSSSDESSESAGSGGSGGSGGSDGSGSDSSSSSVIPNYPEPRTEVAGCGDVSDDPIRYVDGQIQLQVVDVSSDGFGQYWAHERSYSNQLLNNINMGNGSCWCLPYLPQIIPTTFNRFALVGNMNNVIYFEKDPETGIFTTLNGNLEKLTYDDEEDVFYLLAPDGTFSKFQGLGDPETYGKLIYSLSPGGNETTVYRTSTYFQVTRSIPIGGQSYTQYFSYALYGTENNGAHQGLIKTCYLSIKDESDNTTSISKADYTYFDSNSDDGSLNDLQTVTVSEWDTENESWINQGTSYYRYYKSADPNGFQHGLKYVILPDSYAQMVDNSIDPLTASNTTIAQYADNYFEYDTSQRVALERNKGGALTFTFSFSENPALSSSSSGGSTTLNPNVWVNKTIQTLPDSSQNILYFNGVGQTMLQVKKSGDDEWCWFKKYDWDGRVILQAEPSAISGYNEQYPDLLNYSGGSYQYLYDNSGLINLYEYYSTTGSGAAQGYPSFTKIQHGQNGTPINLAKIEYTSRSANGNTIYLPYQEISFPDESNQSTIITTSYAYTFHTGTLQVKQKTITLPVIPTSQNGSGTANSRIEVYDTEGNLIWVKDELGFITRMYYDNLTGGLTQLIEDVDTTQYIDEPTGWVTPSGGGKNLVTDFELDIHGRTTQVLEPTHTIDINGQAAPIRTATWYVYKPGVSEDQVWQARGYQSGTSNNFQYTLINPVSITKTDKYGNLLEGIQATRSSANGKLLPTDSFPQSSYVSWITRQYTGCCLLESERVYHTIPTSGTGSLGTNYDQSSYGYDNMQRQNRATSPGGTISFTVFDVRDNPYQVYVGTDDTGATQQDPTGGGATGNNMVQVSQNQYDNGTDGGDNNLTSQTLYVDSSNTRVTSFTYDWRDRLVDTDGEIGYFQKQYYDNLDRVIKVEQYIANTSGNLTGRSETKYDDLGRVYQTIRYAVDPSTGTVGNSLVDNTWYDPTGKVWKQLPAGSDLFSKREYDSLGRLTTTYTGYDLDETSYADAGTVTGDTILEQTETSYDDAGNVIESLTRMRYHDAPASQTGALQNPSTAPKARVTYQARYPDPIGRVIATADYGTNGGTALSRSSTVPTRSDTVLVSTTAFDSAGRVSQLLDPAAMETRQEYDAAGRAVKVIENYQATTSSSSSSSPGSNPSNDSNRTTLTTYTPDGSTATVTAENPETGNQVTTYTYGTTLSDSEIASSTLLRTETYPDSVDGNDVVTYAYNRQGQPIKRTDQLGTVHEIDYDALGRTTQDRVTTLGTAVDGAIRRIALNYDSRGLNSKISSYDNATVGQGSLVNEVQFAYNDFRQAITSYQSHAGAVNVSTTPKVQYSFANGSDNTVRPASLTYPDGRVLSYSYGSSGSIDDAASRVSAIVDDDVSATHLAEYSYLGMLSPVIVEETEPDVKYTLVGTTGGNDPDTGDIYRGLDRFGRIKDSLWYDYGASADKANIQYGYDRASNRTWRYNPVDTTNSFDEFYTYDGLQRLKETERGELNGTKTGISTLKFAQSWSLDETGNWKGFQQDDTGNGTWDLEQTRASNTVNEIIDITETAGSSWITPAYNKAGNMTTIPQPAAPTASFSATYDAWNRLVKITDSSNTVAEYAYDGRNFRIIQKSYVSGSLDETRHIYYSDSWQALEERIDSETSPEQQSIWGMRYIDDLVLRDRDTTGNGTLDERLYALQDGNWNVTAICDENGDIQERYAYDSYGAPIFLTPSFGSRSSSSFDWATLYAGYRWEAATDLFHVRNRTLNSALGAWLQRDPSGYQDSFSLYSYNLNNPLDGLDPLGLWTWKLTKDGKVLAVSEAKDTTKSLVNQGYPADFVDKQCKSCGNGILPVGTSIDVTGLLTKNVQNMLKSQQNTPISKRLRKSYAERYGNKQFPEEAKTVGDVLSLITQPVRIDEVDDSKSIGGIVGVVEDFGYAQCHAFVGQCENKMPDVEGIPAKDVGIDAAAVFQDPSPPQKSKIIKTMSATPTALYTPKGGLFSFLTGNKTKTATPTFRCVGIVSQSGVPNNIAHSFYVLGRSSSGEVYALQKFNSSLPIAVQGVNDESFPWRNHKTTYFK